MLFRIVILSLVAAACYAGYELWTVRNFYKFLREPDAQFTVVNPGNHPAITIVEFLNYNCGLCRRNHIVLLDYAAKQPEIKLVTRPVPFENAEEPTLRALAAGLQGKFADMDRAMAEYDGPYDEKFYRETCAVYDIDYEKMIADAKGSEVFEFAKNNAAAALRAKVSTTPALMVGKTLYTPREGLTLQELVRMVQVEQGR